MFYMKKSINKLVRDNIPNIIKSEGLVPIIHYLNNEDFETELFYKLREETNEVIEARFNHKEAIKELADVYEVMVSLVRFMGYSMSDVICEAKNKRDVKGGFTERIYLASIKEQL